MSIIYLGDGVRVKTYATKARAAGGAVVSVEFEASTPSAMSYLLHQLEEIRAEQKATEQAAKEERRRVEKAEATGRVAARRKAHVLGASPAPLLLSYRGGEDHD